MLDLYCYCWNEAWIVPKFLSHYGPLCRKIVVYDDGSDDGSVELLKEHPKVEVRPLGEGDSYVNLQTRVADRAWRESVGLVSWVGVVAVDELVGPDLAGYLHRACEAGTTVLRPVGVDLVSETPESQIRTVGNSDYSKFCFWRPDAITAVVHHPGNHRAVFEGRVSVDSPPGLILSHHRFIGREKTWVRYKQLDSRRRSGDRSRQFGYQYAQNRDEFDRNFDAMLRTGQPIMTPS